MSVTTMRPGAEIDYVRGKWQRGKGSNLTCDVFNLAEIGQLLGWLDRLEAERAAAGSAPAVGDRGEPRRGLWATMATVVRISDGSVRARLGLTLARNKYEAIGLAAEGLAGEYPESDGWEHPRVTAFEITPELWAKRWEDPS